MSKLLKKFSALIDKSKQYKVNEALDLLKTMGQERKFIQSIDLEVKLQNKDTVPSRYNITLNHGMEKNIKILAIVSFETEKELRSLFPNITVGGEDQIQNIASTKTANFDIILCSKDMFSKVSKIASILGPLGKMPSSKNGTVSEHMQVTIRDLISGCRLSIKKSKDNFLRFAIGKINFSNEQIISNLKKVFQEIITEIKQESIIDRISIRSTMSPSIILIKSDLFS